MPRPRVKTPVKQRPRESKFRRCGACERGVGADDKFCIGCGKPLNAAPAAAPQKQKQRPKTKPAAPQVKKRKPVTVPAAPQVKKRKPVTVPVAAPQVQKRQPVTAPNISRLDVKQYLETAPLQLHCGRCMHKVRHSDTECPRCGTDWDLCQHKDDQWYRRGECAAYHAWAAWIKGRYVCSECGIGETPELKGTFYDQDGKFPCQHCRRRTVFREKPMPPMPSLMPVDVSSLPPSGLPLPLGDSVRYVSPRTRPCRLCGGYKGPGHFHGLILAGANP